MHAVIVQVKINDFDRGREFLTTQVVPRVSQAPGFVAGYWARTEDDHGRSMIVFESEEAAQTAKQMIETLESAEVAEVVASA
jgi:hypothetical protein